MVFAIHWHESATGVHVFPILNLPLTSLPFPIPWTALLLPSPWPQGHPHAPALSTLSHSLNLAWRSISHVIIYMVIDFLMWNVEFFTFLIWKSLLIFLHEVWNPWYVTFEQFDINFPTRNNGIFCFTYENRSCLRYEILCISPRKLE